MVFQHYQIILLLLAVLLVKMSFQLIMNFPIPLYLHVFWLYNIFHINLIFQLEFMDIHNRFHIHLILLSFFQSSFYNAHYFMDQFLVKMLNLIIHLKFIQLLNLFLLNVKFIYNIYYKHLILESNYINHTLSIIT